MKKDLSLIGLLQALGIIVYCALIGGFFILLGKIAIKPSDFWVSVLILVLLVFSAAVTGSIVFGYSVYLAFNKKIKEALSLLGYTLLYILGFITVILIIMTALF